MEITLLDLGSVEKQPENSEEHIATQMIALKSRMGDPVAPPGPVLL